MIYLILLKCFYNILKNLLITVTEQSELILILKSFKMDELQLSETEQRYFSDLFVCCDNDNTGKVSVNNAVELFRSGNVPLDVLNQVCKLCN